MKNFFIGLILSLLVFSAALARSTGCKEGNCENGYGKWVYTDKTTYEGEWVGTKKNGQGIETWSDGKKYIGKYKDGLIDGQGTMTWSDGKKYTGEFKNG